MLNDPISDMFTRIRNASTAKHDTVLIPYSKIKEKIAAIFKDEGFINNVEVAGEQTKKALIISLKYVGNKKPVFNELKRASKLGRRVYLKKDEIHQVRYGRGIAIITTSKGVMKDSEARSKKVGGEIIATIW